jgi:hypothetical protein
MEREQALELPYGGKLIWPFSAALAAHEARSYLIDKLNKKSTTILFALFQANLASSTGSSRG